MNKVACPTPEQIKGQISALRLQFEEARKQAEDAVKKGHQIEKQIEELQSSCPHYESEPHLVNDGPDIKLRHLCTNCGARR